MVLLRIFSLSRRHRHRHRRRRRARSTFLTSSSSSSSCFPSSPLASRGVSSLRAVSRDSALGRVGVEWLDARHPLALASSSSLSSSLLTLQPTAVSLHSCALRRRLGIVDRPRPPSIMLLMYVVFPPVSLSFTLPLPFSLSLFLRVSLSFYQPISLLCLLCCFISFSSLFLYFSASFFLSISLHFIFFFLTLLFHPLSLFLSQSILLHYVYPLCSFFLLTSLCSQLHLPLSFRVSYLSCSDDCIF